MGSQSQVSLFQVLVALLSSMNMEPSVPIIARCGPRLSGVRKRHHSKQQAESKQNDVLVKVAMIQVLGLMVTVAGLKVLSLVLGVNAHVAGLKVLHEEADSCASPFLRTELSVAQET